MRRRQPRSTRTANLLPYTTLCRADALMSGKNKKGGCGARLGCWTCQQANDKSLETMIQFEPRYEYAKGLNQLNKFIRAIRYDWNRRNWVGRTIRGGFIAIEPDTF